MAGILNAREKFRFFIYLVESIRDCAHWTNLEKMGKVRTVSARVGKYVGLLIPAPTPPPKKTKVIQLAETSFLTA